MMAVNPHVKHFKTQRHNHQQSWSHLFKMATDRRHGERIQASSTQGVIALTQQTPWQRVNHRARLRLLLLRLADRLARPFRRFHLDNLSSARNVSPQRREIKLFWNAQMWRMESAMVCLILLYSIGEITFTSSFWIAVLLVLKCYLSLKYYCMS